MDQVARAMASARKAVAVSYLVVAAGAVIVGALARGKTGVISAVVAAALGAVLCLATVIVNHYGVKYPNYVVAALAGGFLLKLAALITGFLLTRYFGSLDTFVVGLTLAVMIVVTMFAETLALVRARVSAVTPKPQLERSFESC